MTPRTLLILVGLAVVTLGGGWYFGTASTPAGQTEFAGGDLMFPDLTPKLATAVRIEISSQGKTAAIVQKDGRWGLADHKGYPVIDSKLRTLLTALTELRLLEERTANPDLHAQLGVEDPEGKDAKSTLLRVLDGSGQPIVSLIAGHRRVRTQGKVTEQIYVRRLGEARAWLAEASVQADADPQLWLDRDVMNIDAKRISAVTIQRGGQSLAIARQGDQMVLTLPKGQVALDDSRLDDVGRALESITFQDVQPNADKVGPELGRASFTTSDGVTVAATVFKADKDILVRFAVTGDTKGKAEADRITRKVNGWTYRLGAWKEKTLVPSLDDLKKTAESAAQGATAPVGATTALPMSNATPTPTPTPVTPVPAAAPDTTTSRTATSLPAVDPVGSGTTPLGATPDATPAPPAPMPIPLDASPVGSAPVGTAPLGTTPLGATPAALPPGAPPAKTRQAAAAPDPATAADSAATPQPGFGSAPLSATPLSAPPK